MADMTAFERQVGDEILRIVGPAHPVDDLTVFEAVIAANRRQGWGFTMSSALRFVVAGVIVALFGGFLLAGVLTTPQGDETAPGAVTASPTPMSTEALLSTMVTEEVEPGVYHVLNDGVRDLAHQEEPGEWIAHEKVKVDGTGAAVYIVVGERYFRLGAEGERPLGQWMDLPWPDAFTDGRLLVDREELTDLLGPEPATPEALGLGGGISVFEAQADGTLWLLGNGSLVRVPPGGAAEAFWWKDVHDGLVGGLAVTPGGDAWLMGTPDTAAYPAEVFLRILRFDGTDWEVVSAPTEPLPGPLWAGPLASNGMFDVGPDGTLWMLWNYDMPHRSLARYDDSGWAIFDEADGVRPWGDDVRVAPDGSVWVSATEDGGLGRFDGESWVSYLPGRSLDDFEIAPDGAVWVVARARQGGGRTYTDVYVITPEAVAASE